jgi:hypothetical protein
MRAKNARRRSRKPAGVDAHLAEIGPEARFHASSDGRIERPRRRGVETDE